MSETHEHLEHAEHAGHGDHGPDPFTLKVAMTMTIIAALLAAVSMLSHRKHNEALQKQGDVNRLLTDSAAYKVESSNQFAYYQAKRARVEQALNSIAMTQLLAPAPGSDSQRNKEVEKWQNYIKKNNIEEKDITVDSKGMPVADAKGEEDNSPGALLVRGKRFKARAEEKEKDAEEVRKEFEHAHHQAGWLDWAHLATELGLVLCTVCVLTKKREFWLAGMVATLVGVGFAGYGLFVVH
jgi:hypothetical protein